MSKTEKKPLQILK